MMEPDNSVMKAAMRAENYSDGGGGSSTPEDEKGEKREVLRVRDHRRCSGRILERSTQATPLS